MKLWELKEQLILAHVVGDKDIHIKGVQIDSRRISPGDLFICLRGLSFDGHNFALQAVERGAVALMVEERLDVTVPQLIVPDTRKALAMISSYFFGNPTERIKLIGVTGTNGKTTTTHLIHHILTTYGRLVGLIGTNQTLIGNDTLEINKTTPTTPEALDVQRLLHMMNRSRAEFAVMEVTSHALDMGRVNGCHFRTAVFTNLTQDHLEYHRTMDRYRDAKGLLFSRLGNSYTSHKPMYAVLNGDDDTSSHYAKLTAAQVITYGIDRSADVRAKNIEINGRGTSFDVETFRGDARLTLQMIGKFNVYNALAALTTCLLEGVPLAQIKNGLESISGVNGRFEKVNEGQNFTVLVDYAHTPDSLENVLKTIKQFAQGRVYCVIGCGGDRDRSKRPLMAKIAAQYSDVAVLTSDNPRTEDPQSILNDMTDGLRDVDSTRFTMHVDRREAIHFAIHKAAMNDVVLIAGKGHETYQEIKGHRYDFDDRVVAREALKKRKG